MKKTSPSKSRQTGADDLLPEYNFDYRKARPNRFVPPHEAGCLTITLDPDVAAIFTTSESVNTILRALITTMLKTAKP
jgi:hypothetical protein